MPNEIEMRNRIINSLRAQLAEATWQNTLLAVERDQAHADLAPYQSTEPERLEEAASDLLTKANELREEEQRGAEALETLRQRVSADAGNGKAAAKG